MRRYLLLLLVLLSSCSEDAPARERGAEATPPAAERAVEDLPLDSIYGATAVDNLRITRVVLDVPALPSGWDGVSIAALGDLQLGLWEGNEDVATAAVRRAVATNADLVVLLGDYLARGSDTTALERVLEPLRGRRAVAVLGDRDVRSDSLAAAIGRALDRAGVRVLRNTSVTLEQAGTAGRIAGLDPELARDGPGTQEYVIATLAGRDAVLLLTHMPPLAARAPEGGFGAVLAANTVCGSVPVPGTPQLSWLTTEALPGARIPGVERLLRVEETLMFVTCGVGYGFLPVRLSAPPEVALITLRGVEAADTADRRTPERAGPDSLPSADSAVAEPDSAPPATPAGVGATDSIAASGRRTPAR